MTDSTNDNEETVIRFHAGTVSLHGLEREDPRLPASVHWDKRTRCHRAAAKDYAPIVMHLRENGVAYKDEARAYEEMSGALMIQREPRPYQRESLAAWRKHRYRGVVILPTGAGKSHVAVMAIADRKRSALVVAPTLDLVRQWYDLLRTSFDCEVGIVGGGSHQVAPLTVTTYDSAHIHMEHLGARFGLVIFDEVHHLPGETYSLGARMCLAPFRLGLTATPERADGREEALDGLIGPEVYRRDIVEMSGDYLSDYETERIIVHLSAEDRARYEELRGVYKAFIASQGIRMGSKTGWSEFIQRSARSDAGRRAMAAYQEQRNLAFAAPAKLGYVELLLEQHANDRAILFTQDNATAYAISRRFLIPAITHQTKVLERSEILSRLASGQYRAVVTSKVLNEGVDVPDANVAIIVSGSGSVREHVQRLGRVLRKREGKQAILYELVTADTTETYTSARRREHSAYR